jgi:hypothetical protein
MGCRWDGRLRHLVTRKWRAGRSAALIAQELGVGLRQVKELCAQLGREEGKRAGGPFQDVEERRQYSLRVYAGPRESEPKRTAQRRHKYTLWGVNAAVRKQRRWTDTSYPSTARDLEVTGSRRVVRSSAIVARRAAANLRPGKAREARAGGVRAGSRVVPKGVRGRLVSK